MFEVLFYRLRARRVPVSTTELLDFIKAIQGYVVRKGVVSLKEFYNIARSCLVKDIRYFDDFDLTFAEVFGNLELLDIQIKELLENWLKKIEENTITEEQKQKAPFYDINELFQELHKRLREQQTRHSCGNYWIGTSGTSAFGHSGYNKQGVRIGGEGVQKLAIQVFAERKYREYRTDESLQVRQIKVALKKLKILKKQGRPIFSIEKTIEKTSQNGGDLEIGYTPPRKNHLKLMLLMDVGGSMTPHAQKVSKLFSAAHQLNHFKEFHYYYFHNIIYEHVYEDALFTKKLDVMRLLQKIPSDTKVIFVGDAAMSPYELFGYVRNYYYQNSQNTRSGLETLELLRNHYPSSIWLNPDDPRYWGGTTCEAIADRIPMFFLSVDGLEKGIKTLMGN
ncbi:MAG: VWA containing CoxE family protein [Leptospiraceae bacterium]|nr:VWA containing CoxE family protein [Leptospiraceae bacterium]